MSLPAEPHKLKPERHAGPSEHDSSASTFAPEHEEAFLELASSVVDQVRANEPDTLVYMLTKDPERDHTYVWIESYRDQDALAVHIDAPYIADALAKLPGWWSTPPEAIQLRQVLST